MKTTDDINVTEKSEEYNFRKDVNDVVMIFMIGIVAMIVSLGCNAYIESQPTAEDVHRAGSLLIVMIITGTVFIGGGLIAVTKHAAYQLVAAYCARLSSFTKACIMGLSISIGFGAIAKSIYMIDWQGDLSSWRTIYLVCLALFLASSSAGVHNAVYDLFQSEAAFKRQLQNLKDPD